jgi:hypothetical protein
MAVTRICEGSMSPSIPQMQHAVSSVVLYEYVLTDGDTLTDIAHTHDTLKQPAAAATPMIFSDNS